MIPVPLAAVVFIAAKTSKCTRRVAGFLAFAFGLLAYGIYGAVKVALILPGVLLTCLGGQLTLMVMDCVEGLISVVSYIFVAIALSVPFKWSDVSQAVLDRPAGQSLFNPLNSGATQDFNMWFMFIAIFAAAYGWQSLQAGQSFRPAATNAHKQKMGTVLGPWRNEARTLMLPLLCISAYCFLHHPRFASGAAAVKQALSGIENPALRTQMEVPSALGITLPVVIEGKFAAIMLFAMISTDATMMHSRGTRLSSVCCSSKRSKSYALRIDLLAGFFREQVRRYFALRVGCRMF